MVDVVADSLFCGKGAVGSLDAPIRSMATVNSDKDNDSDDNHNIGNG